MHGNPLSSGNAEEMKGHCYASFHEMYALVPVEIELSEILQ